jgi:hypothetical protein
MDFNPNPDMNPEPDTDSDPKIIESGFDADPQSH